jgi:hypothetical protein
VKVTVSFEANDAMLREWFEKDHVAKFLLRLPGNVKKVEISYGDGTTATVTHEGAADERDRLQQ